MQRTHIQWHRDHLSLLDQRLLPEREVFVRCEDAAQTADAIRDMVVRGAPAIGVSAAYGLALAARRAPEGLDEAAALLRAARPTAVNLFWAIDRMMALAAQTPATERAEALAAEAERIDAEDQAMCRAIGAFGAELLGQKICVLTHCNAGGLATAGYGTALGVIRAAVESGREVRVLADETRPYLQGARLTAYELHQDGIDVTVIPDVAAGHLISKGGVDAIVVGADRIAANGDAANKIGTYTLSVLAKTHGVPFYVAAPTSTVDLETPTGEGIPIEERGADEVVSLGGRRLVPEGVPALNPAFDVTPAALITAIITEQGVIRAPFAEGLAAAVRAAGDANT